jgi:glycosyltransferase involved in cell wall biosynthesis
MQVLMVNYEFPPIGGGAATATLFLAKSLLAQGHGVCILTSAIDNLRGWFLEDGIEVARIPTLRKLKDRASIWEMSSFSVSGLLALPKVLHRFKPDCAIIMFTIPCGHIGLALKNIWGIPYIISLRGGDVPGHQPHIDTYHKLLKPLRLAVLANARAVVANSKGLAELSRITNPVSVEVIRNGVDCHYFQPDSIADDKQRPYTFLFVGRFSNEKMLSYLLDQLAVLRQTSTTHFILHIVGDGPEGINLKRQSTQLGLENVVVWHGWIDRERLREIYRKSDCLVNPSLYEGMSNAVLEAMASGLPVIASAVRGNTDTVIHEESGILFDLNQPDGLQQALRKVMGDQNASRTLGLRAREIAQTRFSWDSAAEQYMALFDSNSKMVNTDAV